MSEGSSGPAADAASPRPFREAVIDLDAIARNVRPIADRVAPAAVLAGVSYGVWDVLDAELGRSVGAQIVSLGAGLAAGGLAYLAAVLALRVPEATQALRLIRRRR